MDTQPASAASLNDRADFQATSDPAVSAAAETGGFKLLSYRELYELWERQQWATQDLDFTQDRIDWHERFDEQERFQRLSGLSSFFIGEQRVAAELGPIMRAAPDEEMRIFLCTQIADEARHVAFFDRFYSEVGIFETTDIQERLDASWEHTTTQFEVLFDQLLKERTDRLAVEPEDLETMVEAVTIYHMVVEGMLALTGQHFIIEYNEQQGTLPGFVEGFTNVARDEHRHVAFGARFLREMAERDPKYRDAIQRTLVEVGPAADVYAAPVHPYTRGLIDTVPVADPGLERAKEHQGVRGELPSAVAPPSGCRFRTRCPRAQDLCAAEEPPLRPFTAEGHRAACHFPLREPDAEV